MIRYFYFFIFLLPSIAAAQKFKRVVPNYSAVTLTVADRNGSGVIVGRHSDTLFILTAGHVVKSDTIVSINTGLKEEPKLKGKVIFAQPARSASDTADFALLMAVTKIIGNDKLLHPASIDPNDDIFLYRQRDTLAIPKINSGLLQEESALFYNVYLPGVVEGDSGSALLIRGREHQIAGIVIQSAGNTSIVLRAGYIQTIINSHCRQCWIFAPNSK